MSIAVIIPVLNEEEVLPSLAQGAFAFGILKKSFLLMGTAKTKLFEVAQTILETSSHPHYSNNF